MIEKGLVPPPLKDAELNDFPRGRRRSSRHTGVFLVAAGLGVGLLIGLEGEGIGKAIGVGGLIVLVGVGLLINAFLDRREADKLKPGPDSESAPH